MAHSYYGSIDYDKLLEALKAKKLKTFVSEKTGKRFINVEIYVKDEEDQYGNIASVSTPYKDEAKTDTEKRCYFGNLKKSEYEQKEADFQDEEDDDLPF